MDFSVNRVEAGTKDSEVKLAASGIAHVHVKVSAFLPVDGAASGDEPAWMIPLHNAWNKSAANGSALNIRDHALDQEPYWHLERARIGDTRQVPVELIMNGKPVAHKNIVADGAVQDLAFDVPVARSSWLAVRILGSSHTNPIFVLVGDKPIRASRQSAEWCLAAVNQCWTQKAPKISQRELPAAQAAYDHARELYTKLVAESEQ